MGYFRYYVGVVIGSALLYWAKMVVESKTSVVPTKIVIASCVLTAGSTLFLFVLFTEGGDLIPIVKPFSLVLKSALSILLGVAMGTQGLVWWAKLLMKRSVKLMDMEEQKS